MTHAGALYVRSVEGRLVPRYGVSGRFIGARRQRITAQERRAGAPMIVWDTSVVAALSAAEYRRFRREYDSAIKRGDLKQATRTEYLTEQKRRADADREGRRPETEVTK